MPPCRGAGIMRQRTATWRTRPCADASPVPRPPDPAGSIRRHEAAGAAAGRRGIMRRRNVARAAAAVRIQPPPADPPDPACVTAASRRGRRRHRDKEAAPALCDGAPQRGARGPLCEDTSPVPRIHRIPPDPSDATTRSTPRKGGGASRGIMRRRNVARAADGVRRHPRPRILPIRPDPPDVMVRPTPAPRQGEPVAAAALCDGAPQRGTRGCEDSSPVV
ncbi:hypothetical protein M885DRAFT_213930 [Pelagophyceae sp. CCMP2097]|nr:hypothetical protein M885DRAFT_213930 [Pelagophyceae sp. CCMP2097]